MQRQRNDSVQKDKFSVRGFRLHRQWAVDVDYLRKLPPDAREWLKRFLLEYYDANGRLLRPEKHAASCRECRSGGDCGKRPPSTPLHGTAAQRRELYGLQNAAFRDVYSRGAVMLLEYVDDLGTAETGRRNRGKASLAREEAGDYTDLYGDSAVSPHPANVRKARKQ